VDAESLKKARQRVDKRLKERLAVQKGDSRHDQTLEMARQLAAEGVRKRQELWEQQQAALRESDLSNTKPSTQSAAPDANADIEEADTAAANANDAEVDKNDGSDDTSPIPEMEAETIETAPESVPEPAPEEEAAAPSGTAVESEPVPDEPPRTNASPAEIDAGHQHRLRSLGRRLSQLLPLVAWLILVAGISGATLSWWTLAEAGADMQVRQMMGGNSTNLGLLLGFAYLVTGVLGFAFFWVSSLINRQLKDIRRLLLLQPMPRSETIADPPGFDPEETQDENSQ
jgi:hypothetical protein